MATTSARVTRTSSRSHGPSATGGSLRRFVELTVTLARTDFKLRYFGSALGYFWQLARPLLFFGVLYVFFTKILKAGRDIPHYGVYLLTGIVLWTFFAEATGNAVVSLVNRETLLRKIRFPRLAVPLAVTLTSVFNLAMNSIAVIVFALANGIYPALSWLWMFPIIVGFILLALGIGMLLSALYVRFRDVQPIWDVGSQILFYATPIMYLASSYGNLEHVALLNPFGWLMTQMGHAFLHTGRVARIDGATGKDLIVHGHTEMYEPFRTAYTASGGALHTAIALAIIPAVFALGLWFFAREAPRVAENL